MADIDSNELVAKPVLRENVLDYFMGADTDPDYSHADFSYYRPLTRASKDLSPLTQQRMQEIALLLYTINPMAHRILDLITAFAVGGQVMVEAEDARIQQFIKEHWENPINNWNRRIVKGIFELGLYGEICLNTAVNKKNGDVLLAYVSPLAIEAVSADKEDPSIAAAVTLKAKSASGKKQKLPIIRYNPERGLREGECFFWAINKVGDSLRGKSDLLSLADQIDSLDRLLFNLLERVAHLNSWIWDVTIQGASDEQIRAFLTKLHNKPPMPGAIRAHNELVTWEAAAPELQGTDQSELFRMFKNYTLGGAGIPDWFYGESSEAGRAIAESMQEPTLRTFKMRQMEARWILEDVFNFLIDQKIQAGIIPRHVDRRFFVSLPKISLRDFQRTAGALYRAVQAVEVALQNNLIDQDRAVSIIAGLLDQLDLESDYERGRFGPAPKRPGRPSKKPGDKGDKGGKADNTDNTAKQLKRAVDELVQQLEERR